MKPLYRSLYRIPTLIILIFATLSSACTNKQLIQNTSDIIEGLKGARPIVVAFLPENPDPETTYPLLLARIDVALKVAADVKAGFGEGKTVEILPLLESLTRSIEQLIENDTALIPAGDQRRKWLAVLGGASIALHLIASRLHQTATGVTPAQRKAWAEELARNPEALRAWEWLERRGE